MSNWPTEPPPEGTLCVVELVQGGYRVGDFKVADKNGKIALLASDGLLYQQHTILRYYLPILPPDTETASPPDQLSRLFEACDRDHEYSALEALCFRAGILWRCEAGTDEFPADCGANNPEDSKFCVDCGTARTAECQERSAGEDLPQGTEEDNAD